MDRDTELRKAAEIVMKLEKDDEICCQMHQIEIASYVFVSLTLRYRINPNAMIACLSATYDDLLKLKDRMGIESTIQELRDRAIDASIAESETCDQVTNEILATYGVNPPKKA